MKLSISEEFGLALSFLNLLFFKCASHGFDKFGEIMLCVRYGHKILMKLILFCLTQDVCCLDSCTASTGRSMI